MHGADEAQSGADCTTVRLVLEKLDNRFLEGGNVGLWSKRASLNVRSFKVLELK